jgi:hypothetical protein
MAKTNKIEQTEIPALVKGAKVAAAGTNDAFWKAVEKELTQLESKKIQPKHIAPRK